MKKDLSILKTLKIQGFMDIDQIFNYLETLDYDLNNNRYIGKIISTNQSLAKYFFRDKLKIDINSSDSDYHIHEILYQCIDWSNFCL